MELPLKRTETLSTALGNKSNQKEMLHYPVINKVASYESYDNAYNQVLETLEKAIEPVIVSFINAHGYNLCFSNPAFAKALINSDFLLRDGKGMEIMFRALGKRPGVNMIGTDFIPFMLERMEGKTIALLGTEDPFLSTAAEIIEGKGLNVMLTQHGFLSPSEYLDMVKAAKPGIILLGMGMPKQELVSDLLKRELGYPCLIINGGAIIDYYGNKVSRAPSWMRKNGLEWVYRFILEPKRMFKRYMIGNVLFIRRVGRLKRTIEVAG